MVCWLMGPDVLPGLPEVEPLHVSLFVPVTVHDETFEVFQKMRVVLPFCTMVGLACRWPVRLLRASGTGEGGG